MSWIPPDISQACAVHTTITTCQPQTFLFLQMIASLFGESKDGGGYQQSGDFGFYGSAYGFGEYFGSFGGFGGHDNGRKTEEFDFIVVGAGSAGCVVANRLSEVPHWRVLLLEAGGEEPQVADVPAFAPALQTSSIDWAWMTQPSHHSCLGWDNQQCSWAGGKVMGGSSTINYMIYIRGNPRDYDEWAEMGNHGWSYHDVLPYFLKSEDNQNIHKVGEHYHSKGGYLSVGYFPYQDKNVFSIIDAYAELGLEVFDQNGERQIGASLLQHTQHKGRRESSNSAFIRPIRRKRKNLTVRTNSEVIRVLIDPHKKSAYGVEYMNNGKLTQVFAKKEVIVSAGAIMSPKILMLSGLGPSHHLHEYGIEVLEDLPVGQNLQDHTTIDGVLMSLNKTATTASDEQITQDIYYYKEKKHGPLASTGPLQANAFIQTKYEYEHDRADIQVSIDATNVKNVLTDPNLAAQTNVMPLAYYDGFMIRPILLNPKSRGYIQLNDSDPIHGVPLIHPNTFYEEIDLRRIVEGVKQSINLERTHIFKKLGIRLVRVNWPNCDSYKFGTDEYWACIAQSYTTTIFHPAGTCKMGPKDDHEAVVDPRLRVRGIKKLRVIDASIMPKIVRGNTNAPTMMIGERGSDFIKETWLGDGHGSNYVTSQEEYY